MKKRNITKTALLMLAGATLDMSTVVALTPAPKPRPTEEVIARYVPWKGYRYSPQLSKKDWSVSESRKRQLLADIGSIRREIRAMASKQYRNKFDYHQDKLMKEDKLIGNVIVNAMGDRQYVELKKVRQYL